ncbi:MAG: hypothetical protein ACRD2X_09485 [Vicinamibacteraceae bacterium]
MEQIRNERSAPGVAGHDGIASSLLDLRQLATQHCILPKLVERLAARGLRGSTGRN